MVGKDSIKANKYKKNSFYFAYSAKGNRALSGGAKTFC